MAGPASVQAPRAATRTPAEFATHSLEYVLPSQPHTGLYSAEQNVGRVVQVPAVPQPVPAQYWLRALHMLLSVQPPTVTSAPASGGTAMQHARHVLA